MFYAYYSLLVYEIQAVYITLFLRNRDLLTFWCCFTHMISEILNYCLKHFLKQSRPENGPPSGGGLFEGRYGMPSQHCHCFSYLATMLNFLTLHYYRKHISVTKKVLILVVTTLCLALQIHGRIYLRYHTLDQCLYGVLFGFISALTFYLIGLKLFLPYSQYLCNLWPLKFLHFSKDLVSKKHPLEKISIKNK